MLDEVSQAACEDPQVAEEMRLCVWPMQVWNLETLIGLDEESFLVVSEYIKARIHGWSRCPKTSKLVENIFNHCRSISSGKHKAMSADRVQYAAIESQEDIRYDRPIPKVSCAAKLGAVNIEKAAFKAIKNDKYSLGEKLLDKFAEAYVAEVAT